VRSAGPERRPTQALRTSVPCLLGAVAAVQQPTAGHAQLGGHGAGQQFGLVVPATASTSAAGWRPGDDIHLADAHAPHHQAGDVASDRAPVAVLEPVNDLPSDALERQRGHDAGLADLGRCAGQREAAAVAERIARLVAAGTESGEEHGGIGTRRV